MESLEPTVGCRAKPLARGYAVLNVMEEVKILGVARRILIPMNDRRARQVAFRAAVGSDGPEHLGLKVAYRHSFAARR
jgi:hypothetical protein